MASVKELKSGKVGRSTKVDVPFVVSVRNHVGLSQSEFAHLARLGARAHQTLRRGKNIDAHCR